MRPFQMPRLVPSLAFDRAPLPGEQTRRYDADGRLHCKNVHISKAAINQYLGREIVQFQALGLDPDRRYRLLRDPVELTKAAASFNNLPLLGRHVHATAKDHKPDDVVGSLGSDAEFVFPYLNNSLVVWSSEDIAAVEDGSKAKLSFSYRYTPDMTPGTFQGEAFDGRMTAISGSHVSLVVEGRAGPDCSIGGAFAADEMPLNAEAVFRLRFPDARAPRRL